MTVTYCIIIGQLVYVCGWQRAAMNPSDFLASTAPPMDIAKKLSCLLWIVHMS